MLFTPTLHGNGPASLSFYCRRNLEAGRSQTRRELREVGSADANTLRKLRSDLCLEEIGQK